jgi:hypothetical protein
MDGLTPAISTHYRDTGETSNLASILENFWGIGVTFDFVGGNAKEGIQARLEHVPRAVESSGRRLG